jgi:hypothetical protein
MKLIKKEYSFLNDEYKIVLKGDFVYLQDKNRLAHNSYKDIIVLERKKFKKLLNILYNLVFGK